MSDLGENTFKGIVQLLSCVQLFCDSVDCSTPDSSLHGISQARILKWVAISFPRGSSDQGTKPVSPAFTTEPPAKLFKRTLLLFSC